ncbi:MAG: hypothetical protein HY079_07125 [Elusimicrobia bacterium]|nr:hypothetical protein [Elusimicrobiota bacterium]
MVRTLAAALLVLAVRASAAPVATASFEDLAARIHATVRAQRAASVKALDAGTAQRLDSLAWDLERSRQDASRLRDDLRWLMNRVRAPQQPGRQDPNLRWELQNMTRDLARVARDAQWSLDQLRSLSSQVAGKDPTLVASAQNLSAKAGWLQSDAHWLVFDAGFASMDLMRAGYSFESMDLDRGARDLDRATRDLQAEAQRLLDKVR